MHHAGTEPETRSSSDSPSHGYRSSLPRASAIPNTHTSSTPHSSVANGSTTIPSNVHSVAWRTSTRRSDARSSRRPHRGHSTDGAGANATPLATFSVFNVQGLKPRTVPSKVSFLKDLMHQGNQLFIALSETWLRDHRDAEVAIDGYTIFGQDRQPSRNRRRGRDSGGVAFYIRDDIAATAEPVLNFSNRVVEVLGLYFKSENLFLINLYRQPDDVVGGRRSTWKEFKQALDQIRSTLSSMPSPIPETVICGDFNLPHAAWPEGEAGTGASKDEKAMIKDLKYLSDEFFLFQQVQESTHKRKNVLDLIFCNNPAFVHSYQCSQSIFSDHHIVEVTSTYSHRARESILSAATCISWAWCEV